MGLSSAEFISHLKADLEAKKAMHQHPWVKKFERGELTREQVRGWIEQFYQVVGKDIHRIMGGFYFKCPDPAIRQEIVLNLLEEEQGKVSGTAGHPELCIRLAEALGSSRERIQNLEPLPETRALRCWYELAMAPSTPFVDALAMGVAGEAQLPGAAARFTDVLEQKYGLSHAETAFWWVHEEMDREHSDGAYQALARVATTDEEQRRARSAVKGYLDLWWLFFDGLERAYGDMRKAA